MTGKHEGGPFSSHRGFTLVKMVVAGAIIGIVAAILLPMFASVHENGRRTAAHDKSSAREYQPAASPA